MQNIGGKRFIKESIDSVTETYESIDKEESESEEDCYYDEVINTNIDLEEKEEKIKILRGKDRISFPKMTKYEMVRILGERTKQLTLGAKSFIKNKEDFDYETIAYEEFKKKLIPFKIIRNLPNNIKEEWLIEELNIDHLI